MAVTGLSWAALEINSADRQQLDVNGAEWIDLTGAESFDVDEADSFDLGGQEADEP